VTAVEEWRPVVGWESWYDVSDLGRVKRVKSGRGTQAGRILNGYVGNHGYRVVSLGRGTRQSAELVLVHELVDSTFLGLRPAGHNVNHRDGVKTNCAPQNLEYTTYKGNVRHATRTGLAPTGSRRSYAKLNEGQVLEIRQAVLRGEYHHDIAGRFGISRPNVSDIARGRTWKHVPMLELTGSHMKHHRPAGFKEAEYQNAYTIQLILDSKPPSL
jgi:hypothetical protein